MLWRVDAIFSGGRCVIFKALLFIYTVFWLQFSVDERQILQTSGNFTIARGCSSNSFDTFTPAVLLIVSSARLFAHVRLSK